MDIILKGKVWQFGDNVTTDYMAPGFAMDYPWEERKKFILHIHKHFAEDFQTGDMIVAGSNFGCGSSREIAPVDLKRLGVGCIVAESFARIFFRNCIAIGLPVLPCIGVSGIFEEGDILEIDFENAEVKNPKTGKVLSGSQLSPELINIVKHGGILPLLESEKPLST
jgi:3-isopropylmalate/(R)-2-methylmalate dehydratase small subunit